MREKIFGEIDQYIIVTQPDDALMEFDVDVGIFIEMSAQLAVFKSRKHLAQSGDLFIRRGLRNQPGRHAFQRCPGGNHLDHFAFRLTHHIDAAARHRTHEALALELGHGLAHWRAANAELLSELPLVEPDVIAVAIDVHRDDRVLEGCIGFLLETRRDVDRRKRRVRC